MIHALRGPQHFVLRPVALRENNLDLRTDEILCQSVIVDLSDCLASCVSQWWCKSPVRSWQTIYKDGVLRLIAGKKSCKGAITFPLWSGNDRRWHPTDAAFSIPAALDFKIERPLLLDGSWQAAANRVGPTGKQCYR